MAYGSNNFDEMPDTIRKPGKIQMEKVEGSRQIDVTVLYPACANQTTQKKLNNPAEKIDKKADESHKDVLALLENGKVSLSRIVVTKSPYPSH